MNLHKPTIDPLDPISTVSTGIGLAERTIHALRVAGKFPEPIYPLDHAARWPRSVWQAWLRKRTEGVTEP